MGQSTLRISDLGLTAALVCREVEIASTEKDQTGRTHFIFSFDENLAPNIAAAIDNYWSNHFEVDARQYFDAIKTLKGRIYSQR